MKNLVWLLVFLLSFPSHASFIAGSGGGTPEGTAVKATGVSSGLVLTAQGDNTADWDSVAGTGDVVGPAASIDGEIVLYDSTTGKLIKRATGSGVVKATDGVYSAAALVNADIDAAAAIARSKLAAGTASHVLINDGDGVMSSEASLAVTRGGLGLTSATAGDILYASGANTWAKLAKGTAGQVLTMNAGATAPEWAAGAATTTWGGITGTLSNQSDLSTALSGKLATTGGTLTGLTTLPDGATWTTQGLTMAVSATGALDKICFGDTDMCILQQSDYDTGAMLFKFATGHYPAITINNVTKWDLAGDSMNMNTAYTRFVHATHKFGWSQPGGVPAPPLEAYFADVYFDVGTNKTYGTATLVNGTVTVSTTKAATGDTLICSRNAPSGTALGLISCDTADIVNGTSFKIEALDAAGSLTDDDSTVNWHIIKTY